MAGTPRASTTRVHHRQCSRQTNSPMAAGPVFHWLDLERSDSAFTRQPVGPIGRYTVVQEERRVRHGPGRVRPGTGGCPFADVHLQRGRSWLMRNQNRTEGGWPGYSLVTGGIVLRHWPLHERCGDGPTPCSPSLRPTASDRSSSGAGSEAGSSPLAELVSSALGKRKRQISLSGVVSVLGVSSILQPSLLLLAQIRSQFP